MPKAAAPTAETEPDGILNKYRAVVAKWPGVRPELTAALQLYLGSDGAAQCAAANGHQPDTDGPDQAAMQP